MSVDVDHRCAIDAKNHTGRRWHLEFSSSAHLMMIVSIFWLDFLDLLIFFLLVITELRRALS